MRFCFLLTVLIISFLTINGCSPQAKSKYYKTISNQDIFIGQGLFYRINNDTVVRILVSKSEIDSTVFIWNGKFYTDFYNKHHDDLKLVLDDNYEIYWESMAMGDAKYIDIDSKHITFQFDDEIKYERGQKYKDFYRANKDTLKQISNKDLKYYFDAINSK